MTNLALVLDRSPRRHGKSYYSRVISCQFPASIDSALLNLKKEFPHLSQSQIICNLVAESLEKHKYLTTGF